MRKLWHAGKESVAVRLCPQPEPGPGEVLVRIRASALCGSELPAWRSDAAFWNTGHEAAGEVVMLGPGCGRLRVGDRVGLSAVQGCGECADCAAGRYTYCPRHVVVSGMHGEYVVSKELGCLPLPEGVPWDVGVLITGDGLGVPWHASEGLRRRGVVPGPQTVVAVFGVGPVGLGNVLVQSHLGAQVVAVDLAEARLAMARTLGARHTVWLGESGTRPGDAEGIAAQIRRVVGRDPDVCLECAGRPESLRAALQAVRTGGTVVCVGEQGALPISPSADLIHRDISLMGSWFYHVAEYPGMVQALHDGLDVGALITHRFSLDQAQEAYELFAAGVTGKVILYPGGLQ